MLRGWLSFRLQIQLSALYLFIISIRKKTCAKAARLFIIYKNIFSLFGKRANKTRKLSCCVFEILKTNGFELLKNKETEEGNFTK